jgi:hypothetical protein
MFRQISYYLQQGLYLRAEAKVPPGGKLDPEVRFQIGLIPSLSMPIGLFLFGFTSYANVHWMGQAVALVLIGEAIFLDFNTFLPYLADCYGASSEDPSGMALSLHAGPHAASASAVRGCRRHLPPSDARQASTFTRSAFACSFPLYTSRHDSPTSRDLKLIS